MSFSVDFEWHVDEAGYDWVAGGSADPAEENSLLGDLFSTLRVGPIRLDRIVRRGGALRAYRPFERFNGLFLPFAKRAISSDGLLEFVNRYGPMTHDGHGQNGEDALIGIGHAQTMSEVLEAYSRDRRSCIDYFARQGVSWSNIAVGIGFEPATGRAYLRMKPSCLVNALWFDLLAHITGDAQFRECAHCRGWFQVGSGTGRRTDARFCSDEHRIAFNSLKRSRRDTSS